MKEQIDKMEFIENKIATLQDDVNRMKDKSLCKERKLCKAFSNKGVIPRI